ncbi:uncharacterized [Tachysurus ichikawai]
METLESACRQDVQHRERQKKQKGTLSLPLPSSPHKQSERADAKLARKHLQASGGTLDYSLDWKENVWI